MSMLFRTSDLPAKERHKTWRSIVCELLGPLDTRIAPGAPLRGEIELGRLGPMSVGRVQASTPHSMHRTPGLIRRDDPGLYRVVLVVSGGVRLEQDGRQARLGTGDFAIYDFGRPYELAYDTSVKLAVFSFPRELLALPEGRVAPFTAVPIDSRSGTGALAAPLLRRVAEDHATYRPDSAARLATVVTDLIGTAVAERADRSDELPDDARRRALLTQVHAFIEQRLGDPELDPATIAAACHISVRRLHRLFESEGTTVAAWIRRRRLERCRADLLAGGAEPVSAIGARWGLPDSAHFSRLFRRTYGVPPAEFRRAHAVR
ncbi:helix-turn-helix domain-containing protein [Nonomuraea sp. NPDC049309]|uniref:AraC-like ligand-binding domain-containing protein n=1 Tax=Nonomuraea sp. NPDC049309 TaxID=3364350 RepID=UPI0037162C35